MSWRYCTPCKVDALDGLVGAGDCRLQGLGAGGDSEMRPPAVVIWPLVRAGSGVEDLDAFDGIGALQT